MRCVSAKAVKVIPYSEDSRDAACRTLASHLADLLESIPAYVQPLLDVSYWANERQLDHELSAREGAVVTPHGPRPVPSCLTLQPYGVYAGTTRIAPAMELVPVDRKRQSDVYRASADIVRAYIRAFPAVSLDELMRCFEGWPRASMRRMRAEALEAVRREADAAASKSKKSPAPTPAPPPAPEPAAPAPAPARKARPPSLSARLERWAYGQLLTRSDAAWGDVTLELLRQGDPELYAELIERSGIAARKSWSGRLAEARKRARETRAAQAAAGRAKRGRR